MHDQGCEDRDSSSQEEEPRLDPLLGTRSFAQAIIGKRGCICKARVRERCGLTGSGRICCCVESEQGNEVDGEEGRDEVDLVVEAGGQELVGGFESLDALQEGVVLGAEERVGGFEVGDIFALAVARVLGCRAVLHDSARGAKHERSEFNRGRDR